MQVSRQKFWSRLEAGFRLKVWLKYALYLKVLIESRLTGDKNKIVILYGARQTGKTTLAKEILDASGKKVIAVNADQQKYVDVLSGKDARKLKGLIGKNEILFIDEAQLSLLCFPLNVGAGCALFFF